MQHKGPRYKTGSFTFWYRLWVTLRSNHKVAGRVGASLKPAPTKNPPLPKRSYNFGTTITFTLASTSPWTWIGT